MLPSVDLAQHFDHFIGSFHIGEHPRHGFELCRMGVPMYFGSGVAGQDHAVVMFNSAPDGGRNADCGGDASHDAGVDVLIA